MSFTIVTDGTTRSSSSSRVNRCVRRSLARRSMELFQLRSQDVNNIGCVSLLEPVCGILGRDNSPGPQTERRSDAGPVRIQHGGETYRLTFLHGTATRGGTLAAGVSIG